MTTTTKWTALFRVGAGGSMDRSREETFPESAVREIAGTPAGEYVPEEAIEEYARGLAGAGEKLVSVTSGPCRLFCAGCAAIDAGHEADEAMGPGMSSARCADCPECGTHLGQGDEGCAKCDEQGDAVLHADDEDLYDPATAGDAGWLVPRTPPSGDGFTRPEDEDEAADDEAAERIARRANNGGDL